LDMSEYMEKHAVSKLIGSPPGYVGYEDGGQLTEKVRRHPWSVVLFDEIEKAHEDVWGILLQIMDDGHLTDSTGRCVDFRNTVIVMTSNIGAKTVTEGRHRLGFSGDSGARAFEAEQDERINEELRSVFRPEFLNRIDEKIIFRRLSREEIRRITRRMLGCVASRFTELGMELELPEDVVDVIANSGYDEKYGARPLRRVIRSLIEDKAAEMLLDGELERGDKVLAAVSSGSVTLTKME
ncbi:MAG: AAA family ATPase, partial [Clostridia bacterium]|nr:AAA family ATPase [Clostridia bacterium]